MTYETARPEDLGISVELNEFIKEIARLGQATKFNAHLALISIYIDAFNLGDDLEECKESILSDWQHDYLTVNDLPEYGSCLWYYDAGNFDNDIGVAYSLANGKRVPEDALEAMLD